MNAAAMTQDPVIIPQRSHFRAAMILAIIADALQILVFPLFIEGAASPAEDLLDLGIGAVLAYLLGWHWEFLPSFFAKLVPGVDLVPFWTRCSPVPSKSSGLRRMSTGNSLPSLRRPYNSSPVPMGRTRGEVA